MDPQVSVTWLETFYYEYNTYLLDMNLAIVNSVWIFFLFAGKIAMGEIKNLELLPQHPNLVQYKGYHFRKDAFWVVIEFCDMGDLSDYYKKYFPTKIPLAHQIHFMYQVNTYIPKCT